MKLDRLLHALTGIPFIDDDKKRELYEFVVREKPRRILELGFAHGTSACVIAAATQAAGYDATIDVVDLEAARAWQDQRVGIEALSARLGVAKPLHVHREARCYTWWLEKKLEAWAVGPAWTRSWTPAGRRGSPRCSCSARASGSAMRRRFR